MKGEVSAAADLEGYVEDVLVQAEAASEVTMIDDWPDDRCMTKASTSEATCRKPPRIPIRAEGWAVEWADWDQVLGWTASSVPFLDLGWEVDPTPSDGSSRR